MSWKIRKLREAAENARRRDDYAELASLYEKLEHADPAEPEWAKRAADAYARLNRQDKELAALLRAAEAYSQAGFLLKAVAVCKRILRLDPSHTQTQERLAELHSGRKRGLQRVVTEPEKIAARSPHIFPPAPREHKTPDPAPVVAPEPAPVVIPNPSPTVQRAPKPKPRSAALLSALRKERLNVVGSREHARPEPAAQPAAPPVVPTALASPRVLSEPSLAAEPRREQPAPEPVRSPTPAPSEPRVSITSSGAQLERRSIPPGVALQEVTLSEVVPASRRLTPAGRRAVYEIPLEIDFVEIDDAELLEAEPASLPPVSEPWPDLDAAAGPGAEAHQPSEYEAPTAEIADAYAEEEDEEPGSRPIDLTLE
ncbi:MAG: hypothetical protein KC492_32015, partial [Myxococcales bacterium]|nr:hypothetical protein [Myxococcales bacterium]